MEKIDLEKLMNAYRGVFPTPQDLVEHLKHDDTDDGEFLTVATDYNCFNDIYEKYGDDDFDDDDLDGFDVTILMIMSIDLLNCGYKVEIKKDSLTAILND